jgi:hypothetical protein
MVFNSIEQLRSAIRQPDFTDWHLPLSEFETAFQVAPEVGSPMSSQRNEKVPRHSPGCALELPDGFVP